MKWNWLVGGTAGIGVVLLILGIWFLRSSESVPQTAPAVVQSVPASSPTTVPTSPPADPYPAYVEAIEKQVQSNDPAERLLALDVIRELGDRRPATVRVNLSRWIKPMLAGGQCDAVAQWASETLLIKPRDSIAVSAYQRARVEALLAAEDFTAALPLARSYYNAALLADAPVAIDLLYRALAGVDPARAGQFLKEQAAGATTLVPASSRGIFKSIPIDASLYAPYIDPSRARGKYDHAMTQGNLLLLADRPVEAREAFLAACESFRAKSADKKFLAAVEGVARSLRAEHGITGPANDLALRLMRCQASVFSQDRWKSSELQFAGESLVAAQLSAEINNGIPCTLGDPIILASLTLASDEKLIAWLQGWKPGTALDDSAQTSLASILSQTQMDAALLFQFAHAMQLQCGEDTAAAPLYAVAAEQAESELSTGTPDSRLAVLRAMKDHMGNSTLRGYKSALWPVIESPQRDARSEAALNTLHSIYSNYVRWTPKEDEWLGQALPHVNVGVAECLYLMNRQAQALQNLEKLDPMSFDSGERKALAWTLGMILHDESRYAEAIPHLQTVVSLSSESRPEHRGAARSLLILCLLRTGREGEAAGELELLRQSDDKPPLLQYCESELTRTHHLSIKSQN